MRFIVIGCGRTGSGLARAVQTAGHHVAVVDTDRAAFDRLGPSFAGTRVHGVGFDRAVLEQAGIDAADGLAAVTGNDEVNAVVARLASRSFHIPKVVARLHDPLKAEIYPTTAPMSQKKAKPPKKRDNEISGKPALR